MKPTASKREETYGTAALLACAIEIATFAPAVGQRLAVALIGPSGAGKTMRVAQLADRLGLERRTLLLGTMLPEDVLGLPRIDGIVEVGGQRRGTTEYTLPQWAADAIQSPIVLHLDEIDKARPEVLATVLTLISDRHVHDLPLHPQTLIVLSGQPVTAYWLADAAAMAISARSVWLACEPDLAEIERLGGIDLSWVPLAPPAELPVLPVPSARQLLWWTHYARAHRGDASLNVVARGLFPGPLVETAVAAAMTERPAIDATAVWEIAPETLDAYLAACDPSHLMEMLAEPEAATEAAAAVAAAIIAHLQPVEDLDLRARARVRLEEIASPALAQALGGPLVFGPFGAVAGARYVL